MKLNFVDETKDITLPLSWRELLDSLTEEELEEAQKYDKEKERLRLTWLRHNNQCRVTLEFNRTLMLSAQMRAFVVAKSQHFETEYAGVYPNDLLYMMGKTLNENLYLLRSNNVETLVFAAYAPEYSSKTEQDIIDMVCGESAPLRSVIHMSGVGLYATQTECGIGVYKDKKTNTYVWVFHSAHKEDFMNELE